MLSIEEAIAHEKELAKEIYVEAMLCHANPDDGKLDDCIEHGKYHEQIAEWLEELKALKNGLNIKCDNLNGALEKGKKIGYKKAIDDFADKLLSQQIVDKSVVRRVKGQLKAGGDNEQG